MHFDTVFWSIFELFAFFLLTFKGSGILLKIRLLYERDSLVLDYVHSFCSRCPREFNTR